MSDTDVEDLAQLIAGQALRIEALEAALREIVQWTEDYRFYAPAVGKIARDALDKDAGQ
jgi:hypothetical protein